MATDTSGKPPPLMGATAIRPPDREGMEKYTYILYDPKNGTVLNRTPKSWALIILFYCVYYSCLAGFWLACMQIFLTIQIEDPSVVADAKPTWMTEYSIIGVNPGVGVRPSQPDENVDSGIFALDLKFNWPGGDIQKIENINKEEGSKGYAYRAHDFFKVYRDNKDNINTEGNDGKLCGRNDGKYNDDDGKFCIFDRDTLKPAVEAPGRGCSVFPYGYGTQTPTSFQPCVFLKLNRIMGLKPKPITADTIIDESLTKDPSSKALLAELKALGYPKEIFIKCEGEYPADKEALEGNLFVYPKKEGITHAAGIPLEYFPYSKFRKGKNENALVAIQFDGLKNYEGRIIHVICKAYYDGVVHSKKNKAGLVKFEMYLKTPKGEGVV